MKITAVNDVIFRIMVKTFTVNVVVTPTNGEDAGIVEDMTIFPTVVP